MFQSTMVEGKNKFLKKLWYGCKNEILKAFEGVYDAFLRDIS